jgi:hypothetical protein
MTAIRAFETPWTWNLYQCLAAIILCSVPVGIVRWGLLWKRTGIEGVKAKMAAFETEIETPRARQNFRWSLVFWIVVALALVIYFNMRQN